MISKLLTEKKLKRFQSFRSIITPSLIKKTGLKLTFIIFLIMIAILCLPWQQTVRGSGRVIAYSPNERAQTIDSPIYGRLGEWFVEEGSFVKKGDPIVKIIDNDPNILKRLNTQKDAILKKLDAIKTATLASQNNVDRLKKLLDQGIVSKREYEKSKIEYSKYITEEAKVSTELAKIDISIARQSTQLVNSPMNGYIQRRKIGQGSQLVKKGDELAILIPDTRSRSVELWISGNDSPFVKIGNKVRLQFEGWPAIQSFGWPSLARGTFGGIIKFADKQINPSGQSRLLIIPDPDDAPWPETNILRQGVRTFGWILLNEVSLGFEVWRNFNGFPPVISQDNLNSKTNKKPKIKSQFDKKK